LNVMLVKVLVPVSLMLPLASLLPLARIVLLSVPDTELPVTVKPPSLLSFVTTVPAGRSTKSSEEPSEPRWRIGLATPAPPKRMVYEAPGAPSIWITSLLGRAGEKAAPAKYGQLPSTLLVGVFQT
jgi:hypothetical protein